MDDQQNQQINTKVTNGQISRSIGLFVGGLIIGSIITTGVFLSNKKNQAIDISDALSTPVLMVDGKIFTASMLPSDGNMLYYSLENNVYDARVKTLSMLGVRIALAKDENKAENPLPPIQELLNVSAINESEAKSFYDQSSKQYGIAYFSGRSFDQVKDELIKQLTERNITQAIAIKAAELKSGGRVQILLKEPVAPTVQLNISKYPTRGNANSTITLVEVADYMCPHCREAEAAIENLYKDLKDKIKFVYVSFPLKPDELSGALAKGAYCANQQSPNLFWKYHNIAYKEPFSKVTASTKNPTEEFNNNAKDIAFQAGLNISKFSACLISNDAKKYINDVQEEFNASKGFQGTPTFYLNGKMIQVRPEQLEATIRAAIK